MAAGRRSRDGGDMEVTDPRGRSWQVGPRWVPWRRVFVLPGSPGEGALPATGREERALVAQLVLAGVVPVLWILELAAALVAVPFTVAARVVRGTQWPVLARCGRTPVWEGWAADSHACEELAHAVREAIRRGELPPRTIRR